MRSLFGLVQTLAILLVLCRGTWARGDARQDFRDFYEPLIPRLEQDFLNKTFRVARLQPGLVDFISGEFDSDNYSIQSHGVVLLTDLPPEPTLDYLRSRFPTRPVGPRAVANKDYEFDLAAGNAESAESVERLEVPDDVNATAGRCFMLFPLGIPEASLAFKDLWLDRSIRVTHFGDATWKGQDAKAVQFQYDVNNVHNQRVVAKDFTVYFDPSNGVCLGREESVGGKLVFQSSATYRVLPTGRVLPKSFERQSYLKAGLPPQNMSRELILDFDDLSVPLADESFRLAAYGIPEPELPVAQPYSAWIRAVRATVTMSWFLRFLAILLLLVAVIIYVMGRKRTSKLGN